jgi:hypothetical protein
MQVNFRSWNFGAVGRKMVFEEIIKTQNAFPLPWLTKSAHLERYPKGSGALQGSKRSLLLFSLRNQVITFWRVFFSGKRRPSELNKFLHSCPAIFPLFCVILVSLPFSFLFVFSFLRPGSLRVRSGNISTIVSRIRRNAVPGSGIMHFMQVNFRSWNFGAVGRSMVFEKRTRNQNLFQDP